MHEHLSLLITSSGVLIARQGTPVDLGLLWEPELPSQGQRPRRSRLPPDIALACRETGRHLRRFGGAADDCGSRRALSAMDRPPRLRPPELGEVRRDVTELNQPHRRSKHQDNVCNVEFAVNQATAL